MGWRRDEVWFDTEVMWFREEPLRSFAELVLGAPSFAGDGPAFAPVPTGLEASRQRRLAKQAARKRRFATRTVPAVALVLGSATMLPAYALRSGGQGGAGPLEEDPPSLTFRLDVAGLGVPAAPFSLEASPRKPVRRLSRADELAKVDWHQATSSGLPYGGSLSNGTQLPITGPDWVTWNPITDSVPNLKHRLYGNEHTIRRVISVISTYRAAHPQAAKVVVGDISFTHGGRMDDHVSHQNGLDVDVYYPRLDRHLSAPIATSQIDLRLAQDLLDGFVASGAQIVFVGYSTGLHGPTGVVVPYPNHENHMHVRFAS